MRIAVWLLAGAMCVPGGCVLRQARRQANRTACINNLHTIGRDLQMYRMEHEEAFAATLAELAKVRSLPAKLLQCPEAAGKGRTCDFFYLAPPKNVDALAPLLVACDLKGNHADGTRNCLRSDGSVSALGEDAFQTELKKPQNAAFAKALAAIE